MMHKLWVLTMHSRVRSSKFNCEYHIFTADMYIISHGSSKIKNNKTPQLISRYCELFPRVERPLEKRAIPEMHVGAAALRVDAWHVSVTCIFLQKRQNKHTRKWFEALAHHVHINRNVSMSVQRYWHDFLLKTQGIIEKKYDYANKTEKYKKKWVFRDPRVRSEF